MENANPVDEFCHVSFGIKLYSYVVIVQLLRLCLVKFTKNTFDIRGKPVLVLLRLLDIH